MLIIQERLYVIGRALHIELNWTDGHVLVKAQNKMHSPDDSFRKLTSLTPIDSVSTSHAGFSIQRGRAGQFADDSFTRSHVRWKEKIFKYFFHHLLLGEKIYLNLFSPPYFVGKNIFKYIFTTVFWGEKIYLNIFSPPYFGGRKYI